MNDIGRQLLINLKSEKKVIFDRHSMLPGAVKRRLYGKVVTLNIEGFELAQVVKLLYKHYSDLQVHLSVHAIEDHKKIRKIRREVAAIVFVMDKHNAMMIDFLEDLVPYIQKVKLINVKKKNNDKGRVRLHRRTKGKAIKGGGSSRRGGDQ